MNRISRGNLTSETTFLRYANAAERSRITRSKSWAEARYNIDHNFLLLAGHLKVPL